MLALYFVWEMDARDLHIQIFLNQEVTLSLLLLTFKL